MIRDAASGPRPPRPTPLRVGFLVVALVGGCLARRGQAKEVALTFDDAPRGDGPRFAGPERTRRLIAELKAAGVRQAAFFVIGRRARTEQGARRLGAYARAGHLIANHSDAHPDLHRVGAEVFIADLARAHQTLSRLPGFRPWFRYPFLHEGRDDRQRDRVRRALRRLGYRDGYVTVDNYDWYLERLLQQALERGEKIDWRALRRLYVETLVDCVRFYDRLALRALKRSPRHVLLLHENDLAALYVGALVDGLRRAGFEIISASRAYGDPIAKHQPNTLVLGQGRVAAIARARGYTGSIWHVSEDEAHLAQRFKDEVH